MENTNLDEQKILTNEIHAHSEKGIASFKEGQALHEAYKAEPEKHNLSDEVAAFSEKLCDGIAELHKATELQQELIDLQRAERLITA
jgi:hypothetical protein